MIVRTTLAVLLTAATLATLPGCAVTRGQESMGAYMDDSGITAQVKSAFVGATQVDSSAISVETLKGHVMLSGFAKSDNERAMAESIARGIKGVTGVTNSILVRR